MATMNEIAIPEGIYFYIFANGNTHRFEVRETKWIGGISDQFRLAKGNAFQYTKSAQAVCNQMNEVLEWLKVECELEKAKKNVRSR